MNTSLRIAAALAVISLSTVSAEARHYAAAQQISYNQPLDVAAIPAYQADDGYKGRRAGRRVAVHARKPIRVASLTPAAMPEAQASLAHTIDGYRDRPAEHPIRSGLVTVQTAANIAITCSPEFAAKAQALLATAVAQGIRFSRITCFSRAGTHVSGSNHHTGDAMDTHPSIPAHVVREAGLRSGCDFSDCQHIDNARNVGGIDRWNGLKHPGNNVVASAARRHYRHRHTRLARQ